MSTATAAPPTPRPHHRAIWISELECWTTGFDVIRFIEQMCTFTNGRWTGEHFLLMPWQKRLILELFEVKADGRRRYRRALIGLPRKAGKTELAAALALYLLLADHEKSAQIYCAAASEEQADMVFEAAKRMCEATTTALPELVDVQMSRLTAKADPYSYLQRLTAKGKTKHGLNIHGCILDELHAWGEGEGDELWAALNTGSAAREQPLQIAITTAGLDLEESRCGQLYQLGRAIERGEQDAGGFYFRWWSAPEGMDYRDPEYPRLASPSYGVTVDEGFYRDELTSVPESVFRRLYGNEWVDFGEHPWVTAEQIQACRLPWFPMVAGAPTWVGVDLAETKDASAVAWAQWFAGDIRPCGHTGEPCLYLDCRTWEQPRRDDGRRDESWEIPQDEVRDFIEGLHREYQVVTNVFDPWHSKLMRQDLEKRGLACEEIWQTGARRAGASSGLYDLINSRRLHYFSGTFERHVRNATIVSSGNEGGYYLAKRRKGRVMDAAMAATNVVYGTHHARANKPAWHGVYVPRADA